MKRLFHLSLRNQLLSILCLMSDVPGHVYRRGEPRDRWPELGNELMPPLIAGWLVYTKWRGAFVAPGLLGLLRIAFCLAAFISPVVFGSLVDLTGSWTIPFYGSIGLLL